MNENKEGMSIAALVCGIFGFVLGCIFLGVIPAIVGLILSIIGLVKGTGKRGFNIAGLILSIIGILITVYVFITSIDAIMQGL